MSLASGLAPAGISAVAVVAAALIAYRAGVKSAEREIAARKAAEAANRQEMREDLYERLIIFIETIKEFYKELTGGVRK